jgi:hypothetical protein
MPDNNRARARSTTYRRGRLCVPCGRPFQPGEAGVVWDTVAGGPVFRHVLCPDQTS